MTGLSLIALFVGIPAAWLALGGIKHLFQRHLIRAGVQGGFGLGLAGIAALTGSLGLNVYGYQRLTWEAPIAEVHVIQALDDGWLVTLSETNKAPQEFLLAGQQWRLEAEVIKWHSWANVLGLDSQYRLERLSGRYADVADSRRLRGSAYDLTADDSTLLDQIPSRWRPWVDTEYGGGVYMPLDAGARYRIAITQTGLLARLVP
jgi:hypothetical protein